VASVLDESGWLRGSRALSNLAFEDQLVVLGSPERSDAGGEDLHEPPAILGVFPHNIWVILSGLVAGAEEGRRPTFTGA
jgi:hypothetical protein